jgi:integrase
MGPLAPILQEYFTAYLVTQRAMSEATIRAYRDTWRLLLTFLSGIMRVPAHQLQLTHLDPAHVLAFLDYLEHERGNSAATRNLRLAAIKSVMAFHANRSPERLDTIARINAIPVKKHPKPHMTFLTGAEAQALLDAVPPAPGPTAETERCSPSRSKPGCGSARSPACRSPASTSAQLRTLPAPARAARTAPPR